MVNYEKVVSVLEEWKYTLDYIYEHKSFSIEPQIIDGVYSIYVTITLTKIDITEIVLSECSEILTLSGINKDAKDFDKLLDDLQAFLKTFTRKIYNKIESLSKGDQLPKYKSR